MNGTRRGFFILSAPGQQRTEKNVLKDVPPLADGYQAWEDAVHCIRRSWKLNGREMVQVFQDLLGLKWAEVQGDFTGYNQNGELLQGGGGDVKTAVQAVCARVKTHLSPRADYGKIGETKQKENETPRDYLDRLRPVFRQNSGLDYQTDPQSAYQQQLKNAFLNGLLPKVRQMVDKQWIMQHTGTLPEASTHAEHAHKHIKKKESTQTGTFVVDGETRLIAFSGAFRNQSGQRGRGRQRHKAGDRRNDREDRHNKCYNCGKEGHFARDC